MKIENSNQQTHEEQKERLGKEKIGKLLAQLAIPAVTAQLVNLLYNIVDRAYIGHIKGIGPMALTGVGICLPMIMIITAFTALVSIGSAARASIFMGQRDYNKAEKVLGNSFSLLIIISIVLTLIFSIFSEPLLFLFGASNQTIGYALDYMKIYAVGIICVQMTLGMNAFITAQGFAKISMLTVLIGAVLNIILDPIFIFVLHMDVKGGALATILSQLISTIWVLHFLTGKRTILRIRRENCKLEWKIIGPCLALGLSPFVMQSTESILSICFNSSLLKYGGDVAVGAMTICASAMSLIWVPLNGLNQGAQPILSYNFGAENKERVKKTFFTLFRVDVLFTVVIGTLLLSFPQIFVAIFTTDPQLRAFSIWALRIYGAGTLVLGAQSACQQSFIALGNAKTSLFMALFRKVILLIPLMYILPLFFQNDTFAVFLAEPIADIGAATMTTIVFMKYLKNYMATEKRVQ